MTTINIDYDKLTDKFLEKLGRKNISRTLEQFCNESLGYVKRNRSKKTYELTKLVCDKLLSYFSSNKPIDTIKLKDVEDFLDWIKKGAPKGIYVYFRTLRAMFNKAVGWNYLSENVFNKVKLQKRQLQKPVYVKEEQVDEIVKHIDNDVVKDAVVTAFYSGCRLGEIVNLTWQDIKLKDDVMLIGNKDFETKGRRQRPVPIHNKVKEILVKRFPKIVKREKHYAFCKSNGYPFTGDYFSRRFKRACRLAGVEEEVHFHCLRHGAATRMIMNGAPLPSVQKILGHVNISTTMVYTHPSIEDLREAIEKL